mmetsp:Transcript_10854/g.22568  ORF Transcript_10854/g.22568 Transcript_10854/m.22568 type:complete len:327 (-) Transcript_10854:940-1920(-)
MVGQAGARLHPSGAPIAAAALALLDRVVVLQQPPVDQRVVHKGLQHRHHAVLVVAKHKHHLLARRPVVALHPAHPHGLHQHPRQPEGHLLGELLPVHRGLEAVAKVDVKDLARVPVQHQVGRVAVAQAQDVPDHAHHRQRARVVGPPVQPHFRGAALEPQHLGQVVARRLVQGVLKDLHLVDQRQVLVVRRHGHHQPVLDVQGDLPRLPELPDQRVQRVAVGHPPDQARVGAQRGHRVPRNAQVVLRGGAVVLQQRVDQAEELHHTLVLPQVLVPLEEEDVVVAVAAVDGQLARPLLGRDHVQLRRERGDGDHGLARHVGPRHRQL